MRREKDVIAKAESMDLARSSISSSESKVEELQNQLQSIIIQKNETEIKMEEAMQDSGWVLLHRITTFLLVLTLYSDTDSVDFRQKRCQRRVPGNGVCFD